MFITLLLSKEIIYVLTSIQMTESQGESLATIRCVWINLVISSYILVVILNYQGDTAQSFTKGWTENPSVIIMYRMLDPILTFIVMTVSNYVLYMIEQKVARLFVKHLK